MRGSGEGDELLKLDRPAHLRKPAADLARKLRRMRNPDLFPVANWNLYVRRLVDTFFKEVESGKRIRADR